MIVGVGIDLCKIQKLRDALERSGDVFLSKIFTQNEIELASKEGDTARYFASRFAAKEAIFKALGVGLFKYKGTEIEIGAEKSGRPTVSISGELNDFTTKMGVNHIFISLSHDGEYATAVAILEG